MSNHDQIPFFMPNGPAVTPGFTPGYVYFFKQNGTIQQWYPVSSLLGYGYVNATNFKLYFRGANDVNAVDTVQIQVVAGTDLAEIYTAIIQAPQYQTVSPTYKSIINVYTHGEGGFRPEISACAITYGTCCTGGGTMTHWTVRDDDNDDAQIDSGEFLKVTMADGAAGTNLSGTGTTGDPYVLALTSPGDTVYTLPVATTTVLGGIELGHATVLTQSYETGSTGTASRTYPVQLNSARQAAVSVPWTDTTYSKATDSALGLVKLEDAAVQSVAANAITTTASRTYGVQFNASDQLVVNVPWTDTGGDAFTTIDVPIGGNPVAVGADTLVLQSTANSAVTNTSSVVMSGNTGTDTIDLITRKFESFIVTCTDEKRVMTTGDKFRFRVPYDFTIANYGAEGAACDLAVKCHVNTPPSSGEGVVFQVDIQKNTNTTSAPSWSSILSTKLTIDAGEYTSTTATTPAVVSGTSLNCDDELLFKVDVCTGAETGLKVIIVGFQTDCQG